MSRYNGRVLPDGMAEAEKQLTSSEKQAIQGLGSMLRREIQGRALGSYRSVERFLTGYSKPSVRRVRASHLFQYLTWLKNKKGVTMNPDELVKDNLVCVFKSDPTDVATKRRHTDFLNDFVNVWLLERKSPESTRMGISSAIRRFYQSNDSELFGDFRVSTQEPAKPAPALRAEDIRVVLKALPLNQRLPLLFVWQAGIEINRVLGLTWSAMADAYPLRLQFYGRKRHKKPYHTYAGRDILEGSKLWREKWTDLQGREPEPLDLIFMGKGGPMSAYHLNSVLRETALALHRQGLVENGNPRSWHTHYLRHSFETEASHAEVKAEIRDFFLGHLKGIQWVYNHRDELHPEDLERDWLKIEPFVSLDYTKALAEREAESKERELLRLVRELSEKVARLEARADASASQAPPSAPQAPNA